MEKIKKSNILFLLLTITFIVLDLYYTSINNQNARILTKPVSIFLIFNYFLMFHQQHQGVIRSLFLSGIGDCLLLNNLNKFTTIGGIFFMFAHFNYIYQFSKIINSINLKALLWLIPNYIFVFYILSIKQIQLKNNFSDNIYLSVVVIMATFASQTNILQVRIGAMLFLLSDSFIILQLKTKNDYGLIVMFTYWTAQLLITLGFCKIIEQNGENVLLITSHKAGKIVILLAGRFAGKKAVIVKNYDQGTKSRKYPHSLVVGLSKTGTKIHRRMSNKKIQKKTRVRTFIKYVNHAHLLPTRFKAPQFDFKDILKDQNLQEAKKNVQQRKNINKKVRDLFQNKYNNLPPASDKSNLRFFYKKLRF